MAGGRPSKYSEELIQTICGRIADGESLRSICRDEGMPSIDRVRCWLRDNPEFQAQYARAREDQADTLFDEIDDIINRPMKNMVEVSKARLQVDAIKWRLGKMAPKRYGDKVDLTSSDGSMTPSKDIQVSFVNPKN